MMHDSTDLYAGATGYRANDHSVAVRDDLRSLVLMDAAEIEAMPWLPVDGCLGVSEKVLWRYGDFVANVMHFAPDAITKGEPHFAAHHHMWVTGGGATIAGRRLTAGSYIHVPPGVPHAITDVGALGCTMFQMYRPIGADAQQG